MKKPARLSGRSLWEAIFLSDGNLMYTHMPFLTRSRFGERILFFCRADDDHPWHIYVQHDNLEPVRLATGFPDNRIECSPAGWEDETGWHVSFIAGGGDADPLFRLYRMDGESLDRFSVPVAIKPTRTGFLYRDRLATGDMLGTVHVCGNDEDRVIEFPGTHIMRITYQADQPDNLLVTCQWKGEETFCTVLYDLATGEQHFLECDGQPAYKPTFFENELLHADRTGSGFEERRLRQAMRLVRTPCRLASVRPSVMDPIVPVTLESAEQMRTSDLTGVEKHLGAAFAIVSELAAGHAYRMRFVGHLHEAENECQSHTDLFQAIRTARKRYQQTGILPDWDKLAGMLYAVMDH